MEQQKEHVVCGDQLSQSSQMSSGKKCVPLDISTEENFSNLHKDVKHSPKAHEYIQTVRREKIASKEEGHQETYLENLLSLHSKTPTMNERESYERSNDIFVSAPNIALPFMSTPLMAKRARNTKDVASTEKDREDDELPNEPLETWLLLANIFFFHVIFGYQHMTFGIYYVEWTRTFGSSKAAAGIIGALILTTESCCGIFATVILEKVGPKRCGSIGVLIAFAGVFSSALAPTLQTLYLTFGIITNFGIAVMMLPASVLILTHFQKHRQFATSISLTGIPCGNVIAPNLVNLFIDSFGWRGAVLIHSGIILNAFVLVQLWPGENTLNSIDNQVSSRDICKRFVDISILRDPLVSLHIFSCTLYRFAIVAIFDHIPSRAVHLGSQLQEAAMLMTMMCVGSLICRIASSFLMKFVNPLASFCVVMTVQSLCAAAITFISSYRQVLGIMFIIGCAQGFNIPSAYLSLVKLSSVGRFARMLAMTNLIGGISSILATPVTGRLFDVTQNYDLPFYTAAAFGLTGGLGQFVVFLLNTRKERTTQSDNIDVEHLDLHRHNYKVMRTRKHTI